MPRLARLAAFYRVPVDQLLPGAQEEPEEVVREALAQLQMTDKAPLAASRGSRVPLAGMALPVAASLQYALRPFDIVFYGVLAVLVQIVAYFVIAILFRLKMSRLGDGDIAPAIGVAAAQIAVGLLNAGALSTP